MIFRFSRPIVHAEVDASLGLTLEGMMNHLQEAAIAHAGAAGFGARHVGEGKTAWLLHKAGIEIARMPRVGETAEVATWITSSSGPRARRSFEMRIGSEVVARAAYVWVYFDVVRKMPRRIDPAMDAAFQPEGGEPAVAGVDELARVEIANPSFAADITIRSTDFDSNRHVNNSIYATFVQTLLHHRADERGVGRFAISFQREIGREVRAVTGRLEDSDGGCRFTIESPGVVHASGEVGLRA
jgi:acyl-ACP thioesterase